MRLIGITTILLSLGCAGPAMAQVIPTPEDLSQMSLEELARLPVTSVSKRAEPIGEAPAAIFVIAADDIRRSGAPSLPEVLRMAPNLSVQRLDALDYAISARGFNGFETANKLLVLVDGRSVYTPLHSGVFWSSVPVMLADIERIEVISGPGGTLWGANAVNGVINIVTRAAADTPGGLVDAGAGNTDRDGAVRYGGKLGESVAWRLYGQAFEREGPGADGGRGGQGGFRLDWANGASVFTVQGDVAEIEHTDQVEDFSSQNVLGRWARSVSDGGSLEAQAYFSRIERNQAGTIETTAATDIQLQHVLPKGRRHQVVWGGGYRSTDDEVVSTSPVTVLPARDRLSLANLLVQDDIAVTDSVSLTLGLKLEHHDFTGAEHMPNARLAWRPDDRTLLWAAISRAVRTPSRIERGLTAPGFLEPIDFQSETLIAYEAGYRGRPTETFSLSVSVFYNDYDKLRTAELRPPGVFPLFLGNGARGETYGVEAWADYQVNEGWRLSAGVATLHKEVELRHGSLDISGIASQGSDPDHVVKLRSQHQLARNLDLDLRLRIVGEHDLAPVPDYVGADVRLAWRPTPRLELAVAGFNLIDAPYPETAYPSAVNVVRNFRVTVRRSY